MLAEEKVAAADNKLLSVAKSLACWAHDWGKRAMNSAGNVTAAAAALLIVLPLGATPAWAYLDPGTGSMLLQLLIGGVAGALVVVKLYFWRLKAFLLGRSQKPEE